MYAWKMNVSKKGKQTDKKKLFQAETSCCGHDGKENRRSLRIETVCIPCPPVKKAFTLYTRGLYEDLIRN